MAAQRKISLVWQHFDEEESDKIECRIYTFGLNLLGEPATTSNTQQISFPTFATCCDADQSEKITQLIIEMTACDLLQLCFTEGKGFCKLKHYIETEYTVPSHLTVTSQLRLSLMFSNVCKWRNVLHIATACK